MLFPSIVSSFSIHVLKHNHDIINAISMRFGYLNTVKAGKLVKRPTKKYVYVIMMKLICDFHLICIQIFMVILF